MQISAGTAAFRSVIAACTSVAQRNASTTLANSTSMPSPVVLTIRPLCSEIFGSISSRRCALSRASVPLLVGTHKPAVARDVRSEDCGQPAFDAFYGQKGAPQPHGPNRLSALHVDFNGKRLRWHPD
jgi:hypothetical protein